MRKIIETLLILVASSSAALAEDVPVSFSEQIAPILLARCGSCHSAQKAKGGFRVHTFEALQHPGKSKAAPLVPGHPDQSEIFQRFTAADPDDRMPQKDEPLSPGEIDLFRRWIAEGAKLDKGDPKTALTILLPRRPAPLPPESYKRAIPITALAFSKDGSRLAASGHHEVTIWNLEGKLEKRITNVAGRVHSIAFHPAEPRLAVAAGDPGRGGEVNIYNLETGLLETNLVRAPDEMLAVTLSADGKRLAAGGADNSIHVFDWPSRKKITTIQQHADWVTSLCFNANATRIASASRDRTARVYDAETGTLETTFAGHTAFIYAVAWLDSGLIASAGRDKSIRLWNAADGKAKGEITGFDSEIYQLAAAGDTIFSASAGHVVREYSAADRHLVRKFEGNTDAVYSVAYSAAAGMVASGCYDGTVKIWNVKTGELARSFIAAPGFQKRMARAQ